MTKYWIGLVALLLAACYCLYAGVFFAWVTATPVPADVRAQASQRAQLWLGGFGASLLISAGLIVRMFTVSRRRARERHG